MTITVFRYSGDKRGDDIVEVLLSTEDSKLSRGQAELDLRAQPSQDVTVTIVYRPGLRVGQLALVHDQSQGVSYMAKIKYIQHRVVNGDNPSAETTLELFKPLVGKA